MASRLGMCITALISAVVLHTESTRELPTIGYFVLFDWIYVLAYLAIFGALLEAVVAHKVRQSGRENLGKRLDLYTGAAITVVYLAGVAAIAVA
jgi:hypothetical protein